MVAMATAAILFFKHNLARSFFRYRVVQFSPNVVFRAITCVSTFTQSIFFSSLQIAFNDNENNEKPNFEENLCKIDPFQWLPYFVQKSLRVDLDLHISDLYISSKP